MAAAPRTLVLLRHGESEWNLKNLFTGWYDADLSPKGEAEAAAGGRLMAERGVRPDVLHTSVQTRAIRTAEIALAQMGRSWIPVRRHWRLNERHYGDLQGLNKAQTAERFGADQVKVWRRSYDVPPPAMARDDERNVRRDPRYAGMPPELVPDTECLADVVDRMLPYWYDAIVPDLAPGRVVLVTAHGNSLRALVKHLSDISDDDITELNIPTGEPLVYLLGDDTRPVEDVPVEERYLRSPEEIRAAAEAVARQAEARPPA
ncbi:MAG TPA: 2,3-diphosphoglycerate-dependent phosphoglycerate mutase [Acidimicrobiales bacterium]|nr:2,3-diphosphoglycerate-dependent phosphoglycerate mutase [Acidimicrobiales bacterium]